MTTRVFRDRMDAGRQLAARLETYARRPDVLVLALPRGGVPVGLAVAQALQVPLDVFLVRKLGVPGHEELAMGAIATGDVVVLNEDVVRELAIPERVLVAVVAQERQELARRDHLYRDGRPAPTIRDRTIILVDDGLATGATMRAAVQAIRQQQPARLVVAVPVGAPQTCEAFQAQTDEVICLLTPTPFYAVGLWYDDFSPTSDQEVRADLAEAAARPLAAPGGQAAPSAGTFAP
jgi:putative phosphoribosyl transferase